MKPDDLVFLDGFGPSHFRILEVDPERIEPYLLEYWNPDPRERSPYGWVAEGVIRPILPERPILSVAPLVESHFSTVFEELSKGQAN